jgi:hypothetical protein
MSKKKVKFLNVRIDTDMHEKLRVKAFHEYKTIQEIVRDFIEKGQEADKINKKFS